MKYVINLVLAFFLVFSACTSESINPDKENPVDPEVPEDNRPSTPCDYDFQSTQANDTLIIECSHDLDDQTITLPENVIVDYKGGEIINGELNFKESGQIDGRLLNYQLNVSGSVKLKSSEYIFDKENWNIVEGKVSDEVALVNKNMLQKAIDITKKLGIETFEIDKLDAYFNINSPSYFGDTREAIQLPSEFNFTLTSNSKLRVQPNKLPHGALIRIFEKHNVKIQGGQLIGDRFTHDYSPYTDKEGYKRDSHEWPVLILIGGSENITVDNTTLKASTGDCIHVSSIPAEGGRTNPQTKWNNNINIYNCIISEGRRNNISVCDGENIHIENNEILDCGLGEIIKDGSGNIVYNSSGVSPSFGIDVEPYVYYKDFTVESIVKYEWVEKVNIKNNNFKGNRNGSIIVYSGNDVTVDGNFSDHSIGHNHTIGSKIINNTLIAREDVIGRIGIGTSDYRTYTDYVGGNLKQNAINNDVIGNTVIGFTTGLKIQGGNAKVLNNKVENCDVGLIVEKAENVEIYQNEYKSSLNGSTGIIFGIYANNINIHDEYFDINGRFISTKDFNRMIPNLTNDLSSYNVQVHKCTFSGTKTSMINNSVGIKLYDNTLNSGIDIKNSDRITFSENNQNLSHVHTDGIVFDNSIESTIVNNIINTHENYQDIIVKNEPSNANNNISGNQ